ncbi:MAG: adenylate/guanylate cyclase domain-containing protein [Spirochaetes bacterium]|nr:adenylate/guanylate cyclase domain-containing protein [Spirochaetota bacterium]
MRNPIAYRVTEENEKFYRVTQRAYFLGLFSHASAVIVFIFLGITELVFFNLLISVPTFIVALILNRLNRVNLAFVLAFFELFIHQVAGVYFTGWEFGFQFWLLYLAGLSFFNPTWGNKVRVLQLILITTSYLLLYLFCQKGVYSIAQSLLHFMYVGNGIIVIIILSLLINNYSISAYNAEKGLKTANKQLDSAHKQTRSLLLNILPESIANRLSGGERQIADSFTNASIIFCDLVGFTKFSADKNAQTIVKMLNSLFYQFDTIVEKMKLEKIKTIGDGYMVAAGVPQKRNDHAYSAVLCALKMMQVIKLYNKKFGTNLNLRIGISSGPVVAGVIGKNKFTYDLWGDPVNTASRMESHGRPGQIQISKYTYEEIKDKFQTESRGSIEIKGKGKMDTYFVKGYKKNR